MKQQTLQQYGFVKVKVLKSIGAFVIITEQNDLANITLTKGATAILPIKIYQILEERGFVKEIRDYLLKGGERT